MVHFVLALVVLLTVIGYKNKYVQCVGFLVLFGFAALRFLYGNDYLSYYMWFEHIHSGGYSPFKTELLYTLLNKYLPSFFVLVALSSALLIFLIYRLLTRNLPTEYVWIGMFIFLINPYLFLMNLSALRQSMATCFFIIAANFAYNKKPLRYLFFVVIAALIHKSAWVLVPMYFLINNKPVKAGTCWVILLTVLALLSLDVLGDVVIWVTGLFNDTNYDYLAGENAQNSVRATLLTSVYFIYTLYNLPRLKGRTLAFGKLYLIGCLLGVLAREVAILTRVQMYFDIFSIVVLPMIFLQVQSRGPVVVNQRNVLITFWDCVNKYLMPFLIVAIYLLRYQSFCTNPLWKTFFTYRTILLLL